MVTGRNSYTTLERINELQHLAADHAQPVGVRERALTELDVIDAGGSITAAHQRTRTALTLAELDHLATDPAQSAADQETARTEAARVRTEEATLRAADLERLAADALARVRATGMKKPRTKITPALPGRWEKRPLRAFVLTWTDLAFWWEHFDLDEIASGLTDEQWTQFTATIGGTVAFAEALDAARQNLQRDTA
jgi:ParB family chromosome partitioning protein